MDIITYTNQLIDLSLGNFVAKGGKGSGNWRHRGRPGKRGGSAPRGAAAPKPPPTDSAFSKEQFPEGYFSKSQRSRLQKEASVLPQEHLDIVNVVTQDHLGKGTNAECNGYNEITMGGSKKGQVQWWSGDLTHEIAHAVSNHQKKSENIAYQDKPHKVFHRFYAASAKKAGFANARELEKHYVKTGGGMKAKLFDGFPSKYAMANSHELFAESYMIYVRTPGALLKRSPGIYNHMRDNIFDGVEYTE